jgi:hypothetical protein
MYRYDSSDVAMTLRDVEDLVNSFFERMDKEIPNWRESPTGPSVATTMARKYVEVEPRLLRYRNMKIYSKIYPPGTMVVGGEGIFITR